MERDQKKRVDLLQLNNSQEREDDEVIYQRKLKEQKRERNRPQDFLDQEQGGGIPIKETPKKIKKDDSIPI